MLQKRLFYFYLQLKMAFFIIPKIFLVITLFSFLVLGIGLYGKTAFFQDNSFQKVSVAFVAPEHDNFTTLAFSFINRMKSVRELVNFVPMEKEEALKALKERRLLAVIEIPELFIEEILNGTNTPAKVLLSSSSLETALFCTLSDTAVSILSTAQAGIYTVDDILFSYQKLESIEKMEEELNNIYFSYTLDRTAYFQYKKIKLLGDFSIPQLYFASGSLFLILYSGIGIGSFFKDFSPNLRLYFKREGISVLWYSLSKTLSLSFIYWIFLLFCFWTASFFPVLRPFLPVLSIRTCFLLFLLTYSIALFFFILYQISTRMDSYILLLCTISTCFLFCSGGIIPKKLLPNWIQYLGDFLPSTIWLQGFLELISDTITSSLLWFCIFLNIFLFGITILLSFLFFRKGIISK